MLILHEIKDGKPSRLRHVRLTGDSVTIGRAAVCTYQLDKDPTVSRVQVTLKRDTDGWWLTDGTVDKPSAAGVFVGDVRITRPIPLATGLEIDIFRGVDYVVRLEVVSEVEEDDLLALDRDTVEVVIPADEIAALRESVQTLAIQVQKLANQLTEHVVSCTQQNDQRASELSAKIDGLASELRPQIDAAHARNGEQDVMIKRCAIGVAAAIICVISGYNLSRDNQDAMERSLAVLQLFLGSGVGASIAIKTKSATEVKSL